MFNTAIEGGEACEVTPNEVTGAENVLGKEVIGVE